MLLEKLFENLALTVNPFATCRLADGWRLRLPCRDWVTLHYTLAGEGELKLGSGELLPMFGNSLAIMPPNLSHSVQCGAVVHETGIDGQGDPDAPICELVAGSLDDLALTVACGRIQVSYAGGLGLFDHLKEAIILDFSDSPQMRHIFEKLIEECRCSGPASAAMMTALMNQCLIELRYCAGPRSRLAEVCPGYRPSMIRGCPKSSRPSSTTRNRAIHSSRWRASLP